MTIREVINLLVEIFSFLGEYLGKLFGSDEEAPEENPTEPTA